MTLILELTEERFEKPERFRASLNAPRRVLPRLAGVAALATRLILIGALVWIANLSFRTRLGLVGL